MSEEIKNAVRAVLEAARTWREREYDEDAGDMPGLKLAVAVDTLETLLGQPIEQERPWYAVLPGDEVRGADGNWYAVTGLWAEPGTGQVTVEINVRGKRKRYGKIGQIPVNVRRPASPERDAIAVLESAGFDVRVLLGGGG